MDNNTNNQTSDNFYSYGQSQNTSLETEGDNQNTAGSSYTSQSAGNTNTVGSQYAGQSAESANMAGNQYTSQSTESESTAGSSNESQSTADTDMAGNAYTGQTSAGSYGSNQRTYRAPYTAPYTESSYKQQTYGTDNTGYGASAGNAGYGGSYGSQQAYGSSSYYQGNAYQGNMNYQNIAPQQPKPEKKKKERKQGGFGIKLVKCAALALVFGLVSGGVFEGVHFIGRQVTGESEVQQPTADNNAEGSVLAKTDSDQKVETTPVSSRYVATDVSDIVDSTMPSIVAITNVSVTQYQSFWGGMPQQYESTSCGSGIIVSQNEEYLYIVTNNHVVEGASNLTVTFNDESTVSAEIKGTDPSTDLAVIKVSIDKIEEGTMNVIKVATLGKSDDLRVGQAAIAIGNALGYGQSVTTGCISALDREVSVSDSQSSTSYTAALIQTDAAINPGNSGGALLNAAGEVIGINSVKYSDTDVEGIGYAIPITTAIPIVEDLITKEKVDASDSAYLGVAGVDVTSDVAKTYNMPNGVYVAQVTAGSAAEQAGIQKGDIIIEFDGRKTETMDGLASMIEYYKAGTTVDVKIMRASNGEYIEQIISVTLGKKN